MCRYTFGRGLFLFLKIFLKFLLKKIWVSSGHNANGFTCLSGELQQTDHFNARLTTGDTKTLWARTGYLGFLRQTKAITAHGGFSF